MTQIVGLMLLKNEDLFVKQALLNVRRFCDRMIVLDHASTDGTRDILSVYASQYANVEVHHVSDVGQSHAFIEELAGGPYWVLGVDGDELYDPVGLQIVRRQLLEGQYNDWWVVFGNVLNCISIDKENEWGWGFLAPPCRSMTKLYNFNMLKFWTNCPQRLHGGDIQFHRGGIHLRYDLYKQLDWDAATFRCLHMCFVPRSTQDPPCVQGGLTRQNVTEEQHMGVKRSLLRWLLARCGRRLSSRWKLDKYRRGPLVKKDVAPFFPTSPVPPVAAHSALSPARDAPAGPNDPSGPRERIDDGEADIH